VSRKTARQRRREKKRVVQGVSPDAPVTPSWVALRRKVDTLASERREWAGLPMPVHEAPLVVAKNHPAYERMHGFCLDESLCRRRKQEIKQEVDDLGYVHVNRWHDREWQCWVDVWQKDGRAVFTRKPADTHGQVTTAYLQMIGIAITMDIEAERRAMKTIRQLLPEHLANAYEITGRFLETSKRSGVTYLFRRLAPTLAFRTEDTPRGPRSNFLAALCLHPIAYYDALPMGAMTPTDDVIAHLVMMRTDEAMFWRKSNQHGPNSPGAQL